MKKFTSRDLYASIITGIITGFIAWKIIDYLKLYQLPGGYSLAWLVVIVPILWIAGVNLGYYFGKQIDFFTRFGRFVAIGFTNTAVDFGVLYLLIAKYGPATGIVFSSYKAISFTVATVHSYLWNKYWTFDSGKTSGGGHEFLKFLSVTVVSLVINVVIATLVLETGVSLGHDPKLWAGIAAIAGSAAALIFSFLGFKIIVFKK
ncbi:MAG TPA: GtrA family protein [Candidatus Paceibacterota bacterium]|nr:GtrA family protein [Candidatus Paceibacterota bacterium]